MCQVRFSRIKRVVAVRNKFPLIDRKYLTQSRLGNQVKSASKAVKKKCTGHWATHSAPGLAIQSSESRPQARVLPKRSKTLDPPWCCSNEPGYHHITRTTITLSSYRTPPEMQRLDIRLSNVHLHPLICSETPCHPRLLKFTYPKPL